MPQRPFRAVQLGQPRTSGGHGVLPGYWRARQSSPTAPLLVEEEGEWWADTWVEFVPFVAPRKKGGPARDGVPVPLVLHFRGSSKRGPRVDPQVWLPQEPFGGYASG